MLFVRVVAAELPTGAWAGWFFMTTMTGWFTFCDSVAASAGVIGPKSASGPSGAALAGPAATACPPIRAIAPAAAASRDSLLPRLLRVRPLLLAVPSRRQIPVRAGR